jgi:hypothetical protein
MRPKIDVMEIVKKFNFWGDLNMASISLCKSPVLPARVELIAVNLPITRLVTSGQ